MENLQLTEETFPPDILQDIQTIERILIDYGATKIILYGSMARGDYRPESDIDICVEGLPTHSFACNRSQSLILPSTTKMSPS